MPVFQTPRLRALVFGEEDLPGLIALNDDPTVLQFTGDGSLNPSEATRLVREQSLRHARFGMARWTLRSTDDGRYLGWCGLRYQADRDIVDLGFRILATERGRGFATEAGGACIRHGLDTLGLERIEARTHTANLASQRVLERLGFRRVGREPFLGGEALSYLIEAQSR